MYKIIVDEKRKRQINSLPSNISKAVLSFLYDELPKASNPTAIKGFKWLKGDRKGQGRYKIRKDYRIIVEINNKEITIVVVEVGHRKNIYGSINLMRYKLKRIVNGCWKKSTYEMPARAFPRFVERAKKIKAELLDMDDNSVSLTDSSVQEQLLQSTIVSEWETIKNYEGILTCFDGVARDILNDIITEEKVHIGQLQTLLDNIGKPVTDDIEVGIKEGEAQIARSDILASCSREAHHRRRIQRKQTRGIRAMRMSSIDRRRNAERYNMDDFHDIDDEIGFQNRFRDRRRSSDHYEPPIHENRSRFSRDDDDRDLYNSRRHTRRINSFDDYDDFDPTDGPGGPGGRAAHSRAHTRSKLASRRKSHRVICSINEAIENDLITEQNAREAYALGFSDGLARADNYLNPEVELDYDWEIEFNEADASAPEQAIYDMGVVDGVDYDESVEDDYDEELSLDQDAFNDMDLDFEEDDGQPEYGDNDNQEDEDEEEDDGESDDND